MLEVHISEHRGQLLNCRELKRSTLFKFWVYFSCLFVNREESSRFWKKLPLHLYPCQIAFCWLFPSVDIKSMRIYEVYLILLGVFALLWLIVVVELLYAALIGNIFSCHAIKRIIIPAVSNYLIVPSITNNSGLSFCSEFAPNKAEMFQWPLHNSRS